MKPASLSKSELLCVCCSVVVGVGWLSCGGVWLLVELFLFTDPMSFRSRGRIVPVFPLTTLNMWSCTYLHLFLPAPSCNMVIILILFNSHHGEWANSSQTGSQRAPPRRWGWKTLSITVFSILFFSAIFALRSWWASVPDGRPWIRGSLWPHFSLRTNELALLPNSVLALLNKQNDFSQNSSDQLSKRDNRQRRQNRCFTFI